VRNALVAALVSSADRPLKPKARRFPGGPFIRRASIHCRVCRRVYSGISGRRPLLRAELAERVAEFQRGRLQYSPGCSRTRITR